MFKEVRPWSQCMAKLFSKSFCQLIGNPMRPGSTDQPALPTSCWRCAEPRFDWVNRKRKSCKLEEETSTEYETEYSSYDSTYESYATCSQLPCQSRQLATGSLVPWVGAGMRRWAVRPIARVIDRLRVLLRPRPSGSKEKQWFPFAFPLEIV